MGRPAIDLTGKRFGKLTVISRVANANDGHARWLCQCDCGNTIEVSSNVLKKGNTKSCGCFNKQVASEKAKTQYKDLTGQRFGRLIALEIVGTQVNNNGRSSKLWRCSCDCGNTNFVTTSHHLLSGNTQSCGCLKSKGEAEIKSLLISQKIKYEQQKIFKDYTNARYDFYLPELNRLIEFDGIQHFQPSGGWSTKENYEITQARDKEKNEYALSHSIPLVRIPYWERDNITLDMLLGDKYLVTRGD